MDSMMIRQLIQLDMPANRLLQMNQLEMREVGHR